MSQKWLKIGSLAVSVIGLGVNLASNYFDRKQLTDELLNSDEFKDLVAKQVEEALKK